MKIEKNTLFGIFSLLMIALVGFFVFVESSSGITGNAVLNGDSGTIQIVTVHVEGGNYILEPNTVKVGIPVRIEADVSRMPGCSKSMVISGFNIKKTVTSKDNRIEFTPTKAGTFNIACSMNMYKGTLTVLDSDGTKSNYIEKASTQGMTCGMSGGCGCGG